MISKIKALWLRLCIHSLASARITTIRRAGYDITLELKPDEKQKRSNRRSKRV